MVIGAVQELLHESVRRGLRGASHALLAAVEIDTAAQQVDRGVVWPHPDSCDVVAHWNGQVQRTETCADLAEAERLACEWWIELPNLMDISPSDLADASTPWA